MEIDETSRRLLPGPAGSLEREGPHRFRQGAAQQERYDYDLPMSPFIFAGFDTV